MAVEFWETVARSLGLNLELVPSSDGQYGRCFMKKNRTWSCNGLFGMMERGEIFGTASLMTYRQDRFPGGEPQIPIFKAILSAISGPKLIQHEYSETRLLDYIVFKPLTLVLASVLMLSWLLLQDFQENRKPRLFKVNLSSIITKENFFNRYPERITYLNLVKMDKNQVARKICDSKAIYAGFASMAGDMALRMACLPSQTEIQGRTFSRTATIYISKKIFDQAEFNRAKEILLGIFQRDVWDRRSLRYYSMKVLQLSFSVNNPRTQVAVPIHFFYPPLAFSMVGYLLAGVVFLFEKTPWQI